MLCRASRKTEHIMTKDLSQCTATHGAVQSVWQTMIRKAEFYYS